MNPNTTLWPQITTMVTHADRDARDEHGHGYALGLRNALSALKPYPTSVPVVVRAMDVFRLAETLTRTLATSTPRESGMRDGLAAALSVAVTGSHDPAWARAVLTGLDDKTLPGTGGLAALVHFEVGPHRNPVTTAPTEGAAA